MPDLVSTVETALTYTEVVPTPGANEALQIGDQVVLIYDLIQSGDWLLNTYVIDNIVGACEADGRFKLVDNYYDYTAMTLELTFEVLKSGTTTGYSTSLMTGLAPIVVVVSIAVIMSVAAGYLYAVSTGQAKEIKVYRKFIESIPDNPDVPTDVQEAATDALAEGKTASSNAIADMIANLSDSAKTAITLGVVALVALAVLKVK